MFRVERMCAVLDVSRSGYYVWRARDRSGKGEIEESGSPDTHAQSSTVRLP